MDLLKSAKDTWNNHYSKNMLLYPDEEVVRFLNNNRNRKGVGKLIDLGCGSGRHTVTTLEYGYDVIAVDYAKQCLDTTKARVDMLGKDATYILNNDINIPVEDKSIDVVIAWGCFFCNWREKIIEFMQEVRRVLKDDGEIFCDFRKQRDDMYCHSENYGEFIEKDTLLLKRNVPMAGSYLYFTTLEDLKDIVLKAGFTIIDIEQSEFTQKNMTKLNSWYHVVLKKQL